MEVVNDIFLSKNAGNNNPFDIIIYIICVIYIYIYNTYNCFFKIIVSNINSGYISVELLELWMIFIYFHYTLIIVLEGLPS